MIEHNIFICYRTLQFQRTVTRVQVAVEPTVNVTPPTINVSVFLDGQNQTVL